LKMSADLIRSCFSHGKRTTGVKVIAPCQNKTRNRRIPLAMLKIAL
jgi:hypothetical protein